jgi:predicted O-methyltransferase YrrM
MPDLPPPLLAAIDELDRLRTREDAWQIPRVEGELLYHLALAHRATLIVEVGTSYGFSGLWWAAALRKTGGKLHTIDRDPKKVTSSKATFAAAGVADVVTNHLGDARDVLATVPAGLDLAFIDADKPACRAYFDLLWPKVKPGGAILTDNVVTHRKELADYVTHLRARPDANSVELPVGNGVEWTLKTA